MERGTGRSSLNSIPKHYFQGGYDYDFVQQLPKRFECPICLLCQRDPHQTSCGHRFCHSCIITWLNEGKTCPDDNCSLGEGDIFHDSMANREILQLMIFCPRKVSGCSAMIHLSDVENHLKSCKYVSTSPRAHIGQFESDTCPSCGNVLDQCHEFNQGQGNRLICPNSLVACPFTSAGCSTKIMRKDLQDHIKSQTSHHVSLLWDKLQKIQQNYDTPSLNTQSSVDETGSSSMREGALSRDSDLRLSGSNLHSTQKLMKDLFRRVVALEQKNCQLEISNELLQEKLKKVMYSEVEAQGRYCNGQFLWKLFDFPELHRKMRADHHFVIYSKGFYTTVFGYKVCLRSNINLVNGEEYLGVFVHLMQGDNDGALSWPFRGQISLTAIREVNDNFFETIKETPLGSKAFDKPTTERNPTGFGFTEFIRVNGLYSGGFINRDNILMLKAEVLSID